MRSRHSKQSYHGIIGRSSNSVSSRIAGILSAEGNTCTSNNNISVDYTTYPPPDDSFMDHMLYRVNEMNIIPRHIKSSLIDFVVDGHVLGRLTPQIAQLLISNNKDGIFELSSSSNIGGDDLSKPTTTFLTLGTAAGTTFEQRTKSVSKVMTNLHNLGYISGWRNELYPVSDTFDNSKLQQPLFLIERAAAPTLGLLEYGVHINGLVVKNLQHDIMNNSNDVQMWMARRSQTKSKFPGYVDHIVAGGQPYGLSLMENVIKECMEEAGIPEDVARRGIRPAGAISYEIYSPISTASGTAAAAAFADQGSVGWGAINRVVLFCFDLYLPQDFVPKAVDGEVESFFLWGLDDIVKSMDPECTDPIKPNCYPGELLLSMMMMFGIDARISFLARCPLIPIIHHPHHLHHHKVIIDYLIRSGVVSSDSPKYLEILRKLRSGPCC